MRFGQFMSAKCGRIVTGQKLFPAIVATSLAFLGPVTGEERPSRLELADKIRMVEDGNGSSRPFFRVQFNVVDEQGSPLSIVPPKDPTEAFEVAESGGVVHRPLALRYGQETLSQIPSDIPSQRYALLLIDVSGSMLDSTGEGSQTDKYTAAKTAAQKFLTGFQSGQDHVAVVPFESHQVQERVKAATFAEDLQTAERQLSELPSPQRHFNTALYSAVDAALEVLAEVKRRNPAAGTLLVVLTDGQNQVLRGDDPDLLAGSSGLEAVVAKAELFGVQIMTIGFGDESVPAGRKGALDVEALKRLAWPNASQFHAAQDVQSLGKLFGVARQLLVNRWQLTFSTQHKDRGELAGYDLQFQIRLRLADRLLQSSWVPFKTPQMSAPPFEGKLDAAERQALALVASKLPVAETPLETGPVGLRRVLILAAFGGLLAFLWFAVPLALWPSSTLNPPSQQKAPASKAKPSTRAPSSEKSLQGANPPGPAEPTVRSDPSVTQIQFDSRASSTDRTMFDLRGQETLAAKSGSDKSNTSPSLTKIRVAPIEQTLPPSPTGPDATLILDRLPEQSQPGQTQVQFGHSRQRSSLDRTMLDPRGEQTRVPKPDETIIDPRGEQTIILPPKDKPPSKT